MPIYEYRCKECQNVFEAIRPMKDADSSINCAHCQSSTPYRIQSTCYSSTADSEHSSSRSCGGCQGGSCSSCTH